MSETYTNGGGRSDYRLPTVNANDNGKILKVVEGEWQKAENSGGGSSLPEVTDADNGDVLTVVEGEWEAAAPSSGGLTLYGPYMASLSESATISAGSLGTLQLTSVKNSGGQAVSYPATEGLCFVIGATAGVCPIVSFFAPTFFNNEWYDGVMNVLNTTQSPVTLGNEYAVHVMFYSTIEFPLAGV